MHYFYLRIVIVPLFVLSAMLMLIHAQPHDDHELRQILLPEGCPAPCFMGIRPGVTTAEEAIKLLRKSGWADDFEYGLYGTEVKIKWNSHSPSWLTNDGTHGGSVLWIERGLVSEFRIDTTLSLGTMQLILGTSPLQKIYVEHREGYKFLFYAVVYANTSMFTSVSNDCHGSENRFTYQDKIYLGYTQLKNIYDLEHTYDDSWADLMRLSCH